MTEVKEALLSVSERDKPIIINNVEMLKAMAAADPDENRGAESWYVRYENVDYPLKWAVAKAAEFSLGKSVNRRSFHTDDAKEVASDLGFEITKR